jgi:hypothetical protein
LRVTTIVVAILVSAAPALAEWQDASQAEGRGKRIVMQRTPSTGAISRSDRPVSASLYVRCDNPYDDRIKYRGHDYWSIFVLFSESVGSVEARTRYSFDSGEAKESTFMLNQRGTALFLTQQEDDNPDFVKRLAASSSLQINPTLPWVGNPVITFETAGAPGALRQVPCNKKF